MERSWTPSPPSPLALKLYSACSALPAEAWSVRHGGLLSSPSLSLPPLRLFLNEKIKRQSQARWPVARMASAGRELKCVFEFRMGPSL